MTFKNGDLALCVNDRWPNSNWGAPPPPDAPRKGQILRVDEVQGDYLHFANIAMLDGQVTRWLASHFRRIDPDDRSFSEPRRQAIPTREAVTA